MSEPLAAIGVVIPARNEQARLGRCLDSVRAAVACLQRSSPAPVTVRVVVVLDRCTDRSAEVAARYTEVATVEADLGSVGAARAVGTQTVLAGSPSPLRHTWLANTDADSTVPGRWLSRMATLARGGADLVLGTVQPDETLGGGLRRAWRSSHHAGDGHPHVHGANLGIRGSTYALLGGWPRLPSGEDAALVRTAEATGSVRIARTGAIAVTTSSRLEGRAPNGFAGYLSDLNAALGSVAAPLAASFAAGGTGQAAPVTAPRRTGPAG